ncbi:RHS repeat-associated core domain-containing protein [Pseudoxanthomonas wuyuanensis]|nr:RHS repeat-associated core domain-containing protein [Pseudoxanthomonas wuyuanensis]
MIVFNRENRVTARTGTTPDRLKLAFAVLLGLVLAVAACWPQTATAQAVHPLGARGSMGLGTPNGDFTVAQDDLEVKVPGGYVRINRDFDGGEWAFNRQWSGLTTRNFSQGLYFSATNSNCTTIDGITTCDSTAQSGAISRARELGTIKTRVVNDPTFGRDAEGNPLPAGFRHEALARKGVVFSPNSDGSVYVSSKHPRYLVRPAPVPTLSASSSPDNHPVAGKPGQGGAATSNVSGYRWVDRSGQWIEYDNLGRISSYGDRNNVRVWFQYGGHGELERVLDDNGRTVFTLLYADNGGRITEVRDHTAPSVRRVRYEYDSNDRLARVIDARGNTTRFHYGSNPLNGTDNRNKIIKVADAEGRELRIDYGPTGRIEKLTAADGGETTIDYGYDKLKKEFSVTLKLPQTDSGSTIDSQRFDIEGRLIYREVNGKVVLTGQGGSRSMIYIDERNGSTEIQRDNFGEVTKITYPDGSSMSYSYESGSTDLREMTDAAGVIYRYAYDNRGNLIKSTVAAGRPEQQVRDYVYNARGEVETATIKGGANPDGSSDSDVQIRLAYDDQGNVDEFTDGENKVWRYDHDHQGNRTSVVDPLGHEWTTQFDAHGNLVRETDPTQISWQYGYDATDKSTSVTDGRGKVSRQGYDSVGRANTLTDPYGATFTDSYDLAGRLRHRADASGQASSLSYDAAGRIVKVVDGGGLDTLLSYTEVNGQDQGARQPSSIRYPTFERKFRFDSRKRPVQQTELLPDDARVNGIAYDVMGRIKTLTDPNGHARNYEYDALGRLTAVIDQLGNTVSLAYDHRNNVIAVTDQNDKTTRFAYDGRGLLVRETNPLGQVFRYVYDDAGNPIESIRPDGARETNGYDAAGRLLSRKTYRADGGLELEDSFSWDAADNLKTWSTSGAQGVLEYDDADRLLSEAVTLGTVTLTRSYTYYPNGDVKTYTGPDGITLSYTYDGYGGLARLDIPNEGSISITERHWTAPKKVILPGGSVQEIERDGLLNITRLKVRNPNQATVFELVNRYGKLSELTSREADGKETGFEYDDALRLVKADPSFIAGTSETFVLDKAGNRTQYSAVSGAWVYDDANRLQSRGSFSYSYDAAGNLTRRVDTSKSEPQRTTHFVYDALNRLVQIRNGNDQLVARYSYDPFDNRLSKELADGQKTFFLHGEEGLLAEADASGTVVRSYGWNPDGLYSTDPMFQHTGGQYYYYHNDHMGTPWRVTNRAGAVVWSATDYTAYGTAKLASGAQIEQPWRFPGQYLDTESGLHYNLRRYYDADTGRYVSEDPLRFDSAINFYPYAKNSPSNLIDPTGEVAFLIPLVGNYLRCVLGCMAWSALGDLVQGECISLDALPDCAKDCILGMLPIPKPCKFRGMLNGVLAGGSALSGTGLVDGAGSGLADMTNSFPGSTLVMTPDGHKRIDEVRPGDEVVAYAEWLDVSRPEKVTDVIVSHRQQTLVTVTLQNGNSVVVTGGHPMHTPEGWRAAQLLLAGGRLNIRGNDGDLAAVVIAKVESRTDVIPAYNLEVANSHTFFVGEDGILTHNCPKRKYTPKQHRSAWEKKNGKPWPKTEDGKNYHGHHEPPLAEGGQDILGEVNPMHPNDHKALHQQRGDFKKWGAR